MVKERSGRKAGVAVLVVTAVMCVCVAAVASAKDLMRFIAGYYTLATELLEWDALARVDGFHGWGGSGGDSGEPWFDCGDCVDQYPALVVGPPLQPRSPRSGEGVDSGQQHLIELFEFYDGAAAGSRHFGRKMQWADFGPEDHLRHLRDEDIRSRGSAVSIDEAHRRGALHRGVWLAVLRGSAVDQLARSPPRTSVANGTAATAVRGGALKEHEGSQAKRAGSAEVLLLRRGPQLKTCPNAWGLVGEHLEPGETWLAAVRRALEEELSLPVASSPSSSPSPERRVRDDQLIPLLRRGAATTGEPHPSGGGSVLVRIPYPPLAVVGGDGGEVHSSRRKDLQATGLWAIALSPEQAAAIVPDDEAAEHRWASAAEAAGLLVGGGEGGSGGACTPEISSLAALVFRQLAELSLLI